MSNSELKKELGTAVPSFTPELGTRMREIIGAVGGLKRAAEIAGVSSEQVSRWRDGKSRPNLFAIAALCQAAGHSVDWLLYGKDAGHRAAKSIDHIEEFALVPRLSVRAAAGTGAVNYEVEEIPDAMLAFRLEWLRQHGIDPRNAAIITAYGDSMEPTIRHGDALLINTAIQDVRSEGIYVVRVEDTLLVKRISIGLDHITLISDNPAIKDEVITKDRLPDLHIVGRVVWFGREI